MSRGARASRRRVRASLREIAGQLLGSRDASAVLARIADASLEAGRADGAYVEEVDGDEVEVVATTGWGTPDLHLRVPYPGSLTEEVIADGEPERIEDLASETRPIGKILARKCGRCAGLALPLAAEDEPLGALVLIRRPERPGFGPEEVEHMRGLADMASLSFHRTRLLERMAIERHERAAILESVPMGIIRLDGDGRVSFANRESVRLLRFGSAADVVGSHIHDVVHGSDGGDHAREECPVVQPLRTGDEVRDDEGRFQRTDGTSFPVDYASSPLVVGARVPGMVVTFDDVSERREVEEERERLLGRERVARAEAERRAREEEALREATAALNTAFTIEEVIHRIAESALHACGANASLVARVDPERKQIVVVATAGEEVTEEGTRLPYEGSFSQRVLERAEPETIPSLEQAAREGWPVPEAMLERYGASAAVFIPLIDSGAAIGSLALIRRPESPAFRPDEIRRAHTFGQLAALAFRKVHLLNDAERRRDELNAVMESRDRLMRGFTHDVKNPLNAADGHLQLLDEEVLGHLDEKQKEALERVRRGIGEALRLIDDLVRLAEAEVGRIEIEPTSVDVRAAVLDMAGEYRPQAERKGLEIRVVTPDELPVARTDAARVRQILGNLLSNAVKYTDEGGVVIRVEKRDEGPASGSGEWLSVAVSDTGPGLSEEELPHLFQEFVRLERRADGEEKGGSGLGLAISRRVASALGGHLTVDSEVDRGSTFTLWLPLD